MRTVCYTSGLQEKVERWPELGLFCRKGSTLCRGGSDWPVIWELFESYSEQVAPLKVVTATSVWSACTVGWIQACTVLRLTWKCGPTVRYHQFTSIFQHVTKETTAACDVTWKSTRGTKGSRTLPIMIHGWINCLYLEVETVCSTVDVSEGNLPTLLNFLSLLRVPPCNKLS